MINIIGYAEQEEKNCFNMQVPMQSSKNERETPYV